MAFLNEEGLKYSFEKINEVIGNAYAKPSTGIPITDLDDSTQVRISSVDDCIQYIEVGSDGLEVEPVSSSSYLVAPWATTTKGGLMSAEDKAKLDYLYELFRK